MGDLIEGAPRMRIYIAAPFRRFMLAKAIWGNFLNSQHVEPVGAWIAHAEASKGRDEMAAVAPSRIEENDRELFGADAVIAVRVEGEGAAMFSEIARALVAGIPVAFAGEPFLDAYRPACARFDDWHEAATAIIHAAAEVRRGRMPAASSGPIADWRRAAMGHELRVRTRKDEVVVPLRGRA